MGSVRISIICSPSREDRSKCLRIRSIGQIDMKADEESRVAVSEYLTRVNYSLVLGCFEMDFSDGEINFRYGCNVLDAMVGEDALDDLTTLPCTMFNRYGNGLLAVIMGMMTPKAAYEQAEEA